MLRPLSHTQQADQPRPVCQALAGAEDTVRCDQGHPPVGDLLRRPRRPAALGGGRLVCFRPAVGTGTPGTRASSKGLERHQ